MLSYFISDTGVGTHKFKGNSSRILQAISSEADMQVSAATSCFNKPLNQNLLFEFVYCSFKDCHLVLTMLYKAIFLLLSMNGCAFNFKTSKL